MNESVGGKGQGGVEMKGKGKGGKDMERGKRVEEKRTRRRGRRRSSEDGRWGMEEQQASSVRDKDREGSAVKSSALQRCTIFVGFSPPPRVFTFWS